MITTVLRSLPAHRRILSLLIREATNGVRCTTHRNEVRLNATMDADRLLERYPEVAGMDDRQMQAAVREFVA